VCYSCKIQRNIELSTPQDFYSLDKFDLVELLNDKIEEVIRDLPKSQAIANIFLLPYCETCQIILPPKAFHGGTCDACIELHDHHCPWVGICVGKRNNKHFALFLLSTAIHGLLTFLATVSTFMDTFQRNKVDSPAELITIFLLSTRALYVLSGAICSLAIQTHT
jgi:hypothetical protein